MDLVRFLVGLTVFGPALVGVALPVVALFVLRRSLRAEAGVGLAVPIRHPWAALVSALIAWVAVVAFASWLGILVGFGAAWAQAHSAQARATPDLTGLLVFVSVSTISMAGIAVSLSLFLRPRYHATNQHHS